MPWSFSGIASCVLGFLATAVSIAISLVPPPDQGKMLYEVKIIGGTFGAVGIGVLLYYRAQRTSSAMARQEVKPGDSIPIN